MTQTATPAQRAQWSSETAFIFSMAAAAVGLGNLWRFPYMVGENGGGAFVLAYLVCLLVFGLPFMMLEVATGRLAQGSAVQTFRKVHSKWGAWFGWFVVLLTVWITSYYLVITGWTLGYAQQAILSNLPQFAEFTQGYKSVWYFIVVLVLATLILIRGVDAIEKLSKYLMPFLIGIVVLLVVIASQTKGWPQATEFILGTDFSRLTQPGLWLNALGQSFYTLAIGQGYLMTYGSFIPKKTHVPRACIIVAGVETSIALLAGWMIFPFVFSLGLEPDAGSGLAFDTLPMVFADIRGGSFLAMAFFSLFFAAAFSSCLAGLKVINAALSEELNLSLTQAVLITSFGILILGIPSALSFTPLEWTVFGEPILDFMDRFAGTQVVISSGVIGAGLLCWFVPKEKIAKALGTEGRFWLGKIFFIGRLFPLLAVFYILLRIFLL